VKPRKGPATAATEMTGLRAALLIVDEQGAVAQASGWHELFGDPPPSRMPAPGTEDETLIASVAQAVEEARRRGGPVRRVAAVSLDRHRYYSVSAGPAGPGAGGRGTAALVVEITDAFKAGPKEGEEIRHLGHDLRTPLTSMSGAVELLQSGRLGPLAPEQERLLGMLQQGMQMMLTLIEDATNIYRAAARQETGRGDRAAS
jgi:signal transduction histidine kinase